MVRISCFITPHHQTLSSRHQDMRWGGHSTEEVGALAKINHQQSCSVGLLVVLPSIILCHYYVMREIIMRLSSECLSWCSVVGISWIWNIHISMFISSFIKSGQSGMLVCVQFIKLLLNKSLKKQDKNSMETSSIMFLVVGEEQKIQITFRRWYSSTNIEDKNRVYLAMINNITCIYCAGKC